MSNVFEYIDPVTSPCEAFILDTRIDRFPISAHWHYYMEMIYILEGEILVTVNDEVFTAQKGSAVLFHSKSIHSIYDITDHSHAIYYVVKFDDNLLSNSNGFLPALKHIFSYASTAPSCRVLFPESIIGSYQVCDCFSEIIREFNLKPFGYTHTIFACIYKLCAYMSRIWNHEGLDVKNIISTDRFRLSFNNIREYISNNFHENLSVTDIAALCNMAHSTFSKAFKEHYGRTCKEYINYVRVNAAQNLLFFTDHDISFIAQEVGFTDSCYFIRCYKDIKGMTPGQHRKKRGKASGSCR